MPSTIVYESATLRAGRFQSKPGDADFADSGPTRGHLLVFPRETVTITHAGERPIVAGPNLVMIYNRGQVYTRGAITPAGDRCDWFGYPTEAVLDAQRANGTPVCDDDRPFGRLSHARSTARHYLLARLAFESLATDPLLVEEIVLALLDDVTRRRAETPALPRAHVELAAAAQRWLACHFAERSTLDTIARAHGVSMFHLARVFRRATGQSIHAYRTELRLRAALERIRDGEGVSTVALELGFSSHSHFTNVFRRAFGTTPSQLRSSKILTAVRQLAAR